MITPALPKRLPVNRKERFYTGTVLPMIVASNNFADLGLLLKLCGINGVTVKDPTPQTLQFFTEYNYAQSLMTADEFDSGDYTGDTPDLVISGSNWLVVIEAKMYDNPSAAALVKQYDRQHVLVKGWTKYLNLGSSAQVHHCLLLPQGLLDILGNPTPSDLRPFIRWEDVREKYEEVAPKYWLDVLRNAILPDHYKERVSTRRKYQDDIRTGADIVSAFKDGDDTYTWMGRRGGLDGIVQDIASGAWKNTKYGVRVKPLPGKPRWFPIRDFVARVAAHALATPEPFQATQPGQTTGEANSP